MSTVLLVRFLGGADFRGHDASPVGFRTMFPILSHIPRFREHVTTDVP